MKHLLVPAACLLLVTGCSCKPQDTDAAADQAAAQPAGQPADAQPSGGSPGSAALKKVDITEDLVVKYIEYQKDVYALAVKYAEETKKNAESSKGDVAQAMQQVSLAERFGKEMDEKLRARRKEVGLSEEEFSALQDAAQTVATGRALYNQMGGDKQFAEIEAEQKKQIAGLPADQREAATAQMNEMTKSFRNLRDGLDVRQKYGDKAADALMKHADELAKQYWDALKQLGEKK
jgi:hypothetical protein